MPTYSVIKDVPDLARKVIIVTGANGGLGYEATRAFLRKGATVVMACRNSQKAQAALDKLVCDKSLPTGASSNAMYIRLDMADQKSIKQFVTEFMASFNELHVLLNNAGMMQDKKQTTVDGFEVAMGVNHLAQYVLTVLLLPVLERTAGSRVVSVSSVTHALPGFDVEDLMFDRAGREYGMFSAYAYCKLCNLLFAFELAKRLRADGSSVQSIACHPGFTDSPIQGWVTKLFSAISMTCEQGALSLVYAAVDPSVKSGQYIGPDGFLGVRGMPIASKASAQAMDSKLQSRLWELSEGLTGTRYNITKRANSKRVSNKEKKGSKRVSSTRKSAGKSNIAESTRRSSKSASKKVVGSIRA